MPILTYKPDAEPLIKPSLPKIEPDNYKSIVYDDNNVPLHSIISYIEGSSWIVTAYYSQIVSEHNDLREVDPSQADLYQQYSVIYNMELRLTNPLNSSYESQTSISTVSGTATIYPFLIPNVSDYFVSNTFDNRSALFRVTNVERATYNRDSAYVIDFSLVGYNDEQNSLINNIKSKTNREFYFYKDRLTDGLHPFVTTEQSNLIKSVYSIKKELVKYYFSNFFNKQSYTLLVPGQLLKIYDKNVVNFILKILDSSEAEELLIIKELPEDHNVVFNSKTIYDLILERNIDDLDFIVKSMMLVNTSVINSIPAVHGFGYSPIKLTVYPKNPDTSYLVSNTPIVQTNSSSALTQTNNGLNNIYDYSTDFYTVNNSNIQTVYPIDIENSYVLSVNFYTQSTNMSIFEILVKDYIKKQSLSIGMIKHICAKYKYWNKLEQFYLLPILILLLTNVRNESYEI